MPPHNVMEVVARVEASTVDCNCILLVEDSSRKSNFVVANRLVTPQQSDEIASIPLRLLNTSVDSVVICKGTTVAHASTLEQFDLVANIVGTRVVTSNDSQVEVTPSSMSCCGGWWKIWRICLTSSRNTTSSTSFWAMPMFSL